MEDRETARGRSPRLAAGYHPRGCRIGSNVRLLPRCTVGSRQAEHESQGESMEEDDMVISRYGNTLVLRQTDEEGRAASPRSL